MGGAGGTEESEKGKRTGRGVCVEGRMTFAYGALGVLAADAGWLS